MFLRWILNVSVYPLKASVFFQPILHPRGQQAVLSFFAVIYIP
jgi:hypothetical protein